MAPEFQLPFWIQIISALGPTAVALCVGYVAWRQWATAHAKLRFDLFKDRHAVYVAVKELIASAAIHGAVSNDDYQKFVNALSGAEFLFGDDLRLQIKAISDMAWRAMMARNSYNKHSNHPLRDQLIKEENEVLEYVRSQYVNLEALFRPYLDLSRV